MGGKCSTRGKNEKCIHNFGGKNRSGRGIWEELDIDRKVILE
jgi:hypothetical protein